LALAELRYDTSVTDALYEALLVVKDENCIVIGERCTR